MEEEETNRENATGNGQEERQVQKETPNPPIFGTLDLKIGNDDESLYLKLNRIFLSKYSQQEKFKIQELLEAWKDYELQVLLDNDEYIGKEYHHFYKQVDLLAARVYNKVLAYVKQKRTERDDSEESKKWEGLRELCWREELQFSYDRFFWRKGTIKKSGISYSKDGVKREAVEVVPSSEAGVKVNDWIQTCQIPLLKKIQQFLTDVGLLVLEGEADNSFLLKLQRISSKEQKELFLNSIACNAYENAKTLYTRQYKYNGHQQQALQAVRNSLPNYYFYKQSGGEARSIGSLHLKLRQYKFLENRHDYIQWMFPNHYGSLFNSNSYQLTYVESQLFLDDSQLGLRMLFSIYLFLDFMGIRLRLPSLELTVCSYERLREAILINHHNHLRIMRLLACLSVTGFRTIALAVIQLLDQLTAPSQFLKKQRHEFETNWEIYGEETPGVSKARAKAMCFLEDEEFAPDHKILTLMRETMESERQEQPSKEVPATVMQVQVVVENGEEVQYLKDVTDPNIKEVIKEESPNSGMIQDF